MSSKEMSRRSPASLAHELAGHAPGQGGEKRRQGLQVEGDVAAPPQDELVGELADEAVEELLVLPGHRRQPGQVDDDLRLVAALELRQEPGPDAVAEEPEVAVGRVLPEREAFGREPGAEVRPGEAEERPDDRARLPGGDRGDAGQSQEPRPAHQAHEDGLGLIGHGVAGGDLGRARRRGGPAQEAVAQVASGLLEVELLPRRVRTDVGRTRVERQDPAPGEPFDEAGVLAGFLPQPVVEVGQPDLEGHLFAELQEEGGQGDRVGPARHGREDAVAGDDHAVEGRSPERPEDAVLGFRGWHGRVQVMRLGIRRKWRRRDLNPRHCGYEPHALTN